MVPLRPMRTIEATQQRSRGAGPASRAAVVRMTPDRRPLSQESTVLSDMHGRSAIFPGPDGSPLLALAPREGGYIGSQTAPRVRNTQLSRGVERYRDR